MLRVPAIPHHQGRCTTAAAAAALSKLSVSSFLALVPWHGRAPDARVRRVSVAAPVLAVPIRHLSSSIPPWTAPSGPVLHPGNSLLPGTARCCGRPTATTTTAWPWCRVGRSMETMERGRRRCSAAHPGAPGPPGKPGTTSGRDGPYGPVRYGGGAPFLWLGRVLCTYLIQ
jgi:hypothetical protein